MVNSNESLATRIADLRERIVNHPLYIEMHSPEDIRIFMQHHVFAVWDFMTLLKSLQRDLTCVELPWFPVGSAETRYLINEIVLGEESDVDTDGNRLSHFELYLKAMSMAGANQSVLLNFLDKLKNCSDYQDLIKSSALPASIRHFLSFTFEIAFCNKPHVKAAVFTFGREDLIPGMFIELVRELDVKLPESISLFKYYLERHIEVDGDHHSHLALKMTSELCGDNIEYWKEAEAAVVRSLELRAGLWDGILQEIKLSKEGVALES
jgi:hypothetical protein